MITLVSSATRSRVDRQRRHYGPKSARQREATQTKVVVIRDVNFWDCIHKLPDIATHRYSSVNHSYLPHSYVDLDVAVTVQEPLPSWPKSSISRLLSSVRSSVRSRRPTNTMTSSSFSVS